MEEPTKVCRRDQNPLDREGYRLFFEESLVGAALLSPDGLIREANGTLEELLDCPAGDLTGRHVREFSPPEDQVPGGEGLVRLLSGRSRREVLDRRLRTCSGKVLDGRLFAVRLDGPEGTRRGFLVQVVDLTESRHRERAMHHLAYHDLLTDLPNRAAFLEAFDLALQEASRARQILALVFIDLNEFKEINDQLGHVYGDEALRVIAERLRGCLRRSDLVARIGGDEFVMLLPDLTREEQIEPILDKIASQFDAPLRMEDRCFTVTASLGAALFPRDGRDPDALLHKADQAMYRHKARKARPN